MTIGDTSLRAKQNGSTRRLRPIGSNRPDEEKDGEALKLPHLMITVISPIGYYHMVEEMNAHHLTCLLDGHRQRIIALARRQPDGWLCTAARIVAFDSTASRIITRMSAHVSVIPPWLIRTDFISR